jgi:hypothetical protein
MSYRQNDRNGRHSLVHEQITEKLKMKLINKSFEIGLAKKYLIIIFIRCIFIG